MFSQAQPEPGRPWEDLEKPVGSPWEAREYWILGRQITLNTASARPKGASFPKARILGLVIGGRVKTLKEEDPGRECSAD